MSAVQKASQLATQADLPIRVNIVSRAICKEAYNTFKREVEQAFPSQTYQDLITLTLQARETLFFVELKDRVIEIFANPKPEGVY